MMILSKPTMEGRRRWSVIGIMTEAAKTIRARIKVAVWPDGSWTAYGDHTKSAERTMDELIDAAPGGESWHWIEADVPLPATIEGKLVS